MAFTLDFSKVKDTKVENGTYECVVNNVSEGATPSGAEYMNFDLIIRNDIKQKTQNFHIFQRVWRAKDTGKYNVSMINTIAKACSMSDGKSYNSLEDLFNDFIGNPVRVTVKNETSEWKGNKYENLNVKRWEVTKFPNVQHQWKEKPQKATSTPASDDKPEIEVKDEDLPF